ncbi:hypothetical protein HZS_206 [Henneguya salminicola]|nr:hypothetical protein HZS_206 [Henneguya salminicola]
MHFGFEQQFRDFLNYFESSLIGRYLHTYPTLKRALSLVDAKIDTIYMRNFPLSTRHIFNQINRQLIEFIEDVTQFLK